MQAGQKMFWFFNYQINSCTCWTVNVVATTNFANWLGFQIELYRHTKIIIYSFKEKSKSSGRINFFHHSQIYTTISCIMRFPLTQILAYVHASGGISTLVESLVLVQLHEHNFCLTQFFPKCVQCV